VFLDTLDEHRGADIFGAWVRDHAASDPMWAALARGEAVPGMRRRALKGFQRVMRSWARGEVVSEYTYARFQDHADQALAEMTAGTEAGQQVLAFTSAGTIAAMTRTVLGGQDPAMSASLSFELVNASLTTVRFSGDRRTLHRFNAVPHLDAADVTAV
jgi:broad specificity phosphatase PhoE